MASQPDSTNPVAVIRQNLTAMAPEFKAALPAHVSVEKFSRVAMTAIQNTPALANADRRSLFGAFVRLAQDGLLPDGREAAVVMFGNKAQAMPMIAGILKKVRQSGEIASVDCHVVHANDSFQYRPGLDEQPVFEPDWFGDRGEPIGAYAIARTKDGEIIPPEIMNREQIEQVRKVSRAANNGPWVAWWSEMARKTVLRRLSKRLPMSTDLEEEVFSRDDTMKSGNAPAEQVVMEQAPFSANRLDAIEMQIEDPPHDAETGELIEAEGEAPNDSQAATEEAKPKRTRGPNKPKADAEPEQADDFAKVDDQTGVTKHPAEDAADALLVAMKGATTVIDLDRHWKEAEAKGDLEAMPDEVYTIVLAEHEKHGERLGRKVRTAQREAAE
jgi:recombination protein RecT